MPKNNNLSNHIDVGKYFAKILQLYVQIMHLDEIIWGGKMQKT